jgi:hypothetical protein
MLLIVFVGSGLLADYADFRTTLDGKQRTAGGETGRRNLLSKERAA